MRQKATLKGFDYIVSNPPFKLDFSDWRNSIDSSSQTVNEGESESEETRKLYARFFAGVPKIPEKNKDKMAIYLLFIQHIISSLNSKGKAAIVVPTGFLTEGKGSATNIANRIRMRLVDEGWLRAVVSMPSNIFATTGTNVSILFINKENTDGKVTFVDASSLGTKVKENKSQKTLLSTFDEDKIITAVKSLDSEDEFSVSKSFEDIKAASYSFNPGEFFDLSIQYCEITEQEYRQQMTQLVTKIKELEAESENTFSDIVASMEAFTWEK
jgi:type I restriction enzyme M protein